MDHTMKLPAGYAVLSDEEMTYTEGGAGVIKTLLTLYSAGATVVGTGGLARTVSAATDLFDAIDPDLTLRGIREIWLRQAK